VSSDAAEFTVSGVVELVWDSELCSVVVTWLGGATSPEFDALLAAEVAAVERHTSANLLVDCRLQRPLELDVQDRADRDWFPRVISAGLRRFSVVLPNDREAAVQLIDRLGRLSHDQLQIRFFQTVSTAKAWLSEPSRP
jgi:hypothetical protein